MAAGPKLDGAGIAKMNTLDGAMLLLQRIHGLVESYAITVKSRQPGTQYLMNLKRTLPSLAANLKNQFGMISDQVTAVNLSTSRGSSDVIRLRTLREGVAQVKQALEIAIAQTKEKHSSEE